MQQAKWFGGLCGAKYGAEIVPAWVEYLKMTATATIYASSGFAMAADGRQSWGYSPTFRSREGESETVQKIFEITRKDAALAYCIRGETVNEGMSWDIAAELQNSVASLSPRRFADSARFIGALCLDLEGRIEHARQRGQLDGYPTTELCFVGYFRSAPCWIDVQFLSYRNQSGSLHRVMPRDCHPGRNYMSGSPVLNQMILDDDPRTAHLLGLKNSDISLDAATDFARNYIETCCSPLIREVEPDGCKTVGGHIHVATVTPYESSWITRYIAGSGGKRSGNTGFHWVTQPTIPAQP